MWNFDYTALHNLQDEATRQVMMGQCLEQEYTIANVLLHDIGETIGWVTGGSTNGVNEYEGVLVAKTKDSFTMRVEYMFNGNMQTNDAVFEAEDDEGRFISNSASEPNFNLYMAAYVFSCLDGFECNGEWSFVDTLDAHDKKTLGIQKS